jgi:hypothetical protein
MAVAVDLVERWRDLGLALWIATGAIAAAWFVLFGLFAAATEPRRVSPGAETLDLGGPETPAVVNLVASDWHLGQESLPATLLDLAARKLIAIEQVGDSTYLRLRTASSGSQGTTTSYEEMVLDHVRRLAQQSADNTVPAEALTTGPQQSSASWWRQYRKAVERDARDHGLSRARWSPAVHTLLVGSAVAVSVSLALALLSAVQVLDEWSAEQDATSTEAASGCTTTTLPTPVTTVVPTDASATCTETDTGTTTTTTSSSDDDDEGSPVGGIIMLGIVSRGGLISLVETTGKRQRDTPAGREAAARWLGLRQMLAEDPIFATQPPAGVAIWDRHIAYGAALGVAHGAVRALPLGAESDNTAWSAVGGRWRVVHIRYPRLLPPAYGRHPFRATSVGLLQLAAAVAVLRIVPGYLYTGFIPDLREQDADLVSSGVERGAHIVAIVLGTAAALVALRAAWMLGAGFLDLVGGRRIVHGKVLRFRQRGTEKNPAWYMAVDDGTTDRIRAWRFHRHQMANQGSTVRAEVTKRLQHVRDLSDPDLAGRGSTDREAARTDTHEMNAPGE